MVGKEPLDYCELFFFFWCIWLVICWSCGRGGEGVVAYDGEVLEAINQHRVGLWSWEDEVFPVREILQTRGDQ